MEECCKKTVKEAVKEEWDEIHKWKPFLHWCPEWDYLLIDKGDVEFKHCACYQPHPVETEERV